MGREGREGSEEGPGGRRRGEAREAREARVALMRRGRTLEPMDQCTTDWQHSTSRASHGGRDTPKVVFKRRQDLGWGGESTSSASC